VTDTDRLIARLAAEAGPVRRLRSPLLRTAGWLMLAALVIGGVAALHGLRRDLADRLGEAPFLLALGGSLATGVLAAFAAFQTSQPDRSPLWLLLPLPAAAVWLGTIGQDCLTHWVGIAPGAVSAGEAARCVAVLLACSVPLSAAMFWMLRHTARLRSAGPVFAAALAVAALTASGLALVHAVAASALVLLWNLGTAVAVVSADLLAGARLLPA
jgi:hypothetical protein